MSKLRGVTLVMLLLSACKEEVLHDLHEREANRVVARLSDVGLHVEKRRQADGRWALAAAASDSSSIMRLIERAHLVVPPEDELEGPTSFLPSRDEQRQRLERSLARSLETTLRRLQGVLESRVHLRMPDQEIAESAVEGTIGGSAGILVLAEHDAAVDVAIVTGIVSGASGIAPSKVTVLLTREQPPALVPTHARGGWSVWQSIAWEEAAYAILSMGLLAAACLAARIARRQSALRESAV